MKTKITKLGAVQNPVVKTALKEEYVCGEKQKEDVSPFTGYCAVGALEYPIQVGLPARMLRESRNGVSVMGVFTTSVIRRVGDKDKDGTYIIETDNSVYKVEEV